MSQSTTYYRLSPQTFTKLETEGVEIVCEANGHATTQGSALALKYLLLKIVDPEKTTIVNDVFEPMREIPGDTSAFGLSVTYLLQEEVQSAAQMLRTISDKDLIRVFDPEELNKADVYPGGWQWETDRSQASTDKKIQLEFRLVKEFFANAAASREYIVAITG
jgi:hypothetical protein